MNRIGWFLVVIGLFCGRKFDWLIFRLCVTSSVYGDDLIGCWKYFNWPSDGTVSHVSSNPSEGYCYSNWYQANCHSYLCSYYRKQWYTMVLLTGQGYNRRRNHRWYVLSCSMHFLVPADAEQKKPNLMCVFFSSCASSYLLTMTAGYLVNGTGLLYYKPQL